jgi:proton glutamate symport protein
VAAGEAGDPGALRDPVLRAGGAGIVARLCGLSIWILIRILKDELILAYSTASSESVLPRIIEKMEAYGAPASITSFVVPTGYSFNLDGSTLYQSIAAIFIAQLYGIDLSLWQEIVLVLTLMVTSKGIAGVPGVSFVVLLATLGSGFRWKVWRLSPVLTVSSIWRVPR